MAFPFNTSRSVAKPSVKGYEVGERIQGGGMGEVWHAVQRGTNRTVAIKFINESAVSSTDAVQRFRNEVRAVAKLQHTGIAQVYESPVEDDVLFYAMEFVDGGPVDKYVALHDLAIEDRIRLVVAVADAVQHAHLRGVIHRDLKPSNVLVRKDGTPVIVDFGAAKLLTPDDTDANGLTRPGQDIGTLRYMSPEQAAGETDLIDIRTDVHALGVLLYELLAGQLPYTVDDGENEFRLRHAIVEGERVPIRRHEPSVPKDVEAVLDKAIRRDPSERYQSAGEFHDDLTRALRGEPIRARRLTLPYVFSKWCIRHKGRLTWALLSLVLIASIVFWGRNWIEGLIASRQEAEMIVAIQGAARAIEEANPVEAARRLRDLNERSPNWLTHHLHAKADSSIYTINGESIRDVALVAVGDSTRAVIVEEDGRVRHVDVATGRLMSESKLTLPFGIRRCAVSHDGGQLIVAQNGDLYPIDLANGLLGEAIRGLPGTIRDIAWSPDNRLIAVMNEFQQLAVYDSGDFELLRQIELAVQEPMALAFSPDSKLVTAVGRGSTTFDPASGNIIRETPARRDLLQSVAYAGSADRVLVGSGIGVLESWSIAAGEPRTARYDEPAGSGLTACAFSPSLDNSVAIGGTLRGNIAVWRSGVHSPPVMLHGHANPVRFVQVESGGRYLVSATVSEVKMWDLHHLVTLEVRGQGPEQNVVAGALSPVGDLVAIGYSNGEVEILRIKSGEREQLFWLDDFAAEMQFSHDGRHLAIALTDGRIVLHAVGMQTLRWSINAAKIQSNQLRFSRDDRLLAATESGRVSVFSTSDGRLIRTCSGHAVAWIGQSDPQHLLVARPAPDSAMSLVAYDVETGNDVHVTELHGAKAYGIATNEDTTVIAVVLDEGRTQILDATPDGLKTRFVTDKGPSAFAVALSSRGDLVFTAGDGVRARTARSGQEILTLTKRRPSVFTTLRFSTDGRLLSALGSNQYIIWRSR